MERALTDKLKAYLAALPINAQNLLMREFERKLDVGGGDPVAVFVLTQLRAVQRKSGVAEPRVDAAIRLAFQPLDGFLHDAAEPRPGGIQRTLLLPIWAWLQREALVAPLQRYVAACEAQAQATRSAHVMQFHDALSLTLTGTASLPVDERARVLERIGQGCRAEDLIGFAALYRARQMLPAMLRRLPDQIRDFGPAQIVAVEVALAGLVIDIPEIMPFALAAIMRKLPAPWQIIRLPLKTANTDSGHRVLQQPTAVAVDLALDHLAEIVSALRIDIRRGSLSSAADRLKLLHDGVRCVRSEIDIRPDSLWGRQIAAIRSEISRLVHGEIESVPNRIRSVLRQRAPGEAIRVQPIEPGEISDVTSLISFVAICRGYASELALNASTTQVHADVENYVGQSAVALISGLRGGDPQTAAYRRSQVDAAITFSEILFGAQHASLLRRSAANAKAEEALHAESA